MSLEEMAEKYSKKWNVPVEEAKKKIQEFLSKKPEKPVDRTKATPGADNLFPEPLGPLSRKIQDINQAALATAYTHRSLREMSMPPEELKTLKEKIESMEKNVGAVVELVNTTMKEWHEDLKARKAEEERQKLVGEVTEIMKPLKEKVDALEKLKKGETGAGEALGELTPEKLLKVGQEATEKARDWLEKQGYQVEMPKALTIEQVEAKLKETVQEKKKEWEEKAGAEVEIEKERIRATEEILQGITDRIFNIFLEPIKDKIHEAIEKGAFRRGPG